MTESTTTDPDELLAAPTACLAPYREGSAAAHDPGPLAAAASGPRRAYSE